MNWFRLFIIDGNCIKNMSAVSGQMYTYIKSRTVGLKHSGQKNNDNYITAKFIYTHSSVYVSMCVRVCVCLCVKCSRNIHYWGIPQTREWPPELQPNSMECLFNNRRWFFQLENRPCPCPICHSTQLKCLPPPPPSSPSQFPYSRNNKGLLSTLEVLCIRLLLTTKQKAPWKQGLWIICICILPFSASAWHSTLFKTGLI